jgi:hypothetical protein
MGEETNIPTIPYTEVNGKQLELLPKELREGKMHKDFVLTHPTGGYPVCGAQTKNDATKEKGHYYCLMVAGFGTDHVGLGCCKYHGGSGGKKVTGKYSKYLKADKLQKKHEDFMYDPKILSLNEEIAILRTLLTELLAMKYDLEKKWKNEKKYTEDERKKFFKGYGATFNKIESLVSDISRIVETKNKIENGEKHTVRVEVLHFVTVQIIQVIKKYVDNPEVLKQIGYELKNLRLPE